MNFRRWNSVVWLVLLAAGAITACRRVYVVVPRPSGGYKPDTLRATLKGNDARVIFRFDTVTHTRIVRVTDTLWREGKQIIRDTLRIVRRDTVRVIRRDTIRVLRVDTVRLAGAMSMLRDTVRIVRRDTVRLTHTDTVRIEQGRVDTVRIQAGSGGPVVRVDTIRRTDTIRIMQPPIVQVQRRVDTVRVYRTDTLRLVRVDTVHIIRADTIRISVGGGGGGGGGGSAKRTLQVPPGHYPPEGQCRVWIDGMPPGRQRDPAPCDRLGDIPAGAFILFGGEAWDFDFDWVAAGGAPAPIVALQRAKGRRP